MMTNLQVAVQFLLTTILFLQRANAQLCFRAFRPMSQFQRYRGFCGYPLGGARGEMGTLVRSMSSCCRRNYAGGWGFGHSCSSCQEARGWPSAWSQWSLCSRTCEWGQQQRTRTCSTNLCPGMVGKVAVEKRRCIWSQCCPVNGGWSNWSPSTGCSVTCGMGMEFRIRSCSNPRPKCGGAHCSGVQRQYKDCFGGTCAQWSAWAEQGPCSASCGNGTILRLRQCYRPAGDVCAGEPRDFLPCFMKPCPEAVTWCPWNVWSECSATCGNGRRKRSRVCECGSEFSYSPAAGNKCLPKEETEETENCFTDVCSVNGGWGEWTTWGRCTGIPCLLVGKGIQMRTRTCTNPPPAGDGTPCQGDDSAVRRCLNMDNCLVEGRLSEWSSWSPCSRSCGKCGFRERNRECESYFDDPNIWGVDVVVGTLQKLCVNLPKKQRVSCFLSDCQSKDDYCGGIQMLNRISDKSGFTNLSSTQTPLSSEQTSDIVKIIDTSHQAKNRDARNQTKHQHNVTSTSASPTTTMEAKEKAANSDAFVELSPTIHEKSEHRFAPTSFKSKSNDEVEPTSSSSIKSSQFSTVNNLATSNAKNKNADDQLQTNSYAFRNILLPKPMNTTLYQDTLSAAKYSKTSLGTMTHEVYLNTSRKNNSTEVHSSSISVSKFSDFLTSTPEKTFASTTYPISFNKSFSINVSTKKNLRENFVAVSHETIFSQTYSNTSQKTILREIYTNLLPEETLVEDIKTSPKSTTNRNFKNATQHMTWPTLIASRKPKKSMNDNSYSNNTYQSTQYTTTLQNNAHGLASQNKLKSYSNSNPDKHALNMRTAATELWEKKISTNTHLTSETNAGSMQHNNIAQPKLHFASATTTLPYNQQLNLATVSHRKYSYVSSPININRANGTTLNSNEDITTNPSLRQLSPHFVKLNNNSNKEKSEVILNSDQSNFTEDFDIQTRYNNKSLVKILQNFETLQNVIRIPTSNERLLKPFSDVGEDLVSDRNPTDRDLNTTTNFRSAKTFSEEAQIKATPSNMQTTNTPKELNTSPSAFEVEKNRIKDKISRQTTPEHTYQTISTSFSNPVFTQSLPEAISYNAMVDDAKLMLANDTNNSTSDTTFPTKEVLKFSEEVLFVSKITISTFKIVSTKQLKSRLFSGSAIEKFPVILNKSDDGAFEDETFKRLVYQSTHHVLHRSSNFASISDEAMKCVFQNSTNNLGGQYPKKQKLQSSLNKKHDLESLQNLAASTSDNEETHKTYTRQTEGSSQTLSPMFYSTTNALLSHSINPFTRQETNSQKINLSHSVDSAQENDLNEREFIDEPYLFLANSQKDNQIILEQTKHISAGATTAASESEISITDKASNLKPAMNSEQGLREEATNKGVEKNFLVSDTSFNDNDGHKTIAIFNALDRNDADGILGIVDQHSHFHHPTYEDDIHEYSGTKNHEDNEDDFYNYPGDDYYTNHERTKELIPIKNDNCMDLPESQMTEELRECCKILNISESVNGPDSAFERCFTLQFKKIYKIEENFDIEALVETRTHCVCRGKQKILNALCCARSYCNHWQKRFFRDQCTKCRPHCHSCYRSILLG